TGSPLSPLGSFAIMTSRLFQLTVWQHLALCPHLPAIESRCPLAPSPPRRFTRSGSICFSQCAATEHLPPDLNLNPNKTADGAAATSRDRPIFPSRPTLKLSFPTLRPSD